MVDIGEGAQGEKRKISIDLTNWTDQPIRLIGGTTDCSCTVLGDLPVTIGPRETRAVSVDLSLSARPGIFTRQAAFLVDDEGFRQVHFSITGRILKAEAITDVAD